MSDSTRTSETVSGESKEADSEHKVLLAALSAATLLFSRQGHLLRRAHSSTHWYVSMMWFMT